MAYGFNFNKLMFNLVQLASKIRERLKRKKKSTVVVSYKYYIWLVPVSVCTSIYD